MNLARYDRTGRVDKTQAPRTRVWIKDCAICETTFVARSNASTKCRTCRTRSTECRVFITNCATCSKLFASRYTVSTCSAACARIKTRTDKRANKLRRRAIKKAAFVDNVSPRQVYERDRWRCHLCGKAINRRATAPHPKAPTIDHIIPLAVGGTHEPANCRAAHFLCNAQKGHRGGGEQLLLIA
ncbi:HNH endonuclease [Rhodococcus ruber]|uniref:HNH endonuclease n=1 Tax=Rhodococcus ruber TaxID=1830 RepID=UPI003D81A6D5